ncbi:MAG: 30S ribosomal protein S21 [Chloroflexi bacterium]|jgi:small subunit ribosomal protein S21|nr:30S ribosomal protein S21 [Chloroflexota bacterium]
MTSVYRHENESIEQLLRRFKKAVQQDKILTVVRRKRYYEKPSQIRKRNAARKLRKSQKTTRRDVQRRY